MINVDEMPKHIRRAWKILREVDSTIPSEVIDFMRDVALEEVAKIQVQRKPKLNIRR